MKFTRNAIYIAACVLLSSIWFAFAAPTALPGGPYTINEWQTLTLTDGGSTWSWTATISGYSWDINNDLTEDASGAIVNFWWSFLESIFGRSVLANNTLTFPITLTVTDSDWNTTSDVSQFNVINIAPTAGIFNLWTWVNEYYSGVINITRTNISDIASGDTLISSLYYDNWSGLVFLWSGFSYIPEPDFWPAPPPTPFFTDYILDSTTLPNGTYNLYIVTNDGTDTVTGSLLNPIMIDNSVPTISTTTWFISEGNNIWFDTTTFTTSFSPIISYEFDINNDGTSDVTNSWGLQTLTWTQLQSYGIINNNPTLLPNDVYNIALKARNAAGAIATWAYQFKVYNTAPTASFISPITTGQLYSGSISLNWLITDPANGDFPMVVDLYYSTNNTTYTPFVNTTSAATGGFIWYTTGVTNSTWYTLRLKVTDDFWSNQYTSVRFGIDNTAPTITGSMSYTITEGSGVTFSLVATDAIAGVSWFTWNINGNLTGTTTGTKSFTWAQLQSYGIINDGSYTIPVTVSDTLNNSATYNITLIVTNKTPTVSLSQPTATIYSGTTNIAWTATDPANGDIPLRVVLTYSNGLNVGTITSWTALANPYTRNTSLIPDGTGYQITAYVYDDDGFSTGVSNTFTIDNTKPVLSGFASPYTINESSWLIIDLTNTYDALAGLVWGVAGFNGKINNISLPTTTNWYWNLSRANLATYGITNGSGQILPLTISVKDFVGNTANTTGTLAINNIAPTITGVIPTSTTRTGNIALWRTIYDPVDIIAGSLAFTSGSINNTWTTLQTWFTQSTTWYIRNTTWVADGINYYIRITATDDTTTTTKIIWPITINNNPGSWYVGWIGSSNWWWGGGWGWGGWSSTFDTCACWDKSPSYYDGKCVATGELESNYTTLYCLNQSTGWNTGVNNPNTTWSTVVDTTSAESLWAYEFALKYGITTIPTFDTAMPYGVLYRKDAAKMMVQFAKAIGKNDMVHNEWCSYADAKDLNPYTVSFIEESCKLGIMGLKADGTIAPIFNPHDIVTRAQFGTMLSRLIYGNENNVSQDGTIPWYQNHLLALQKNGIMNNISSPDKQEVRLYVWLMLQRTYNTLK